MEFVCGDNVTIAKCDQGNVVTIAKCDQYTGAIFTFLWCACQKSKRELADDKIGRNRKGSNPSPIMGSVSITEVERLHTYYELYE